MTFDAEAELEAAILRNVLGVTAVVGAERPRILDATGAAASEILLLAPAWRMAAAQHALARPGLAPIIPAPDGRLPRRLPALSSLIVLELPGGKDPAAALDRLLAAVVDGGFLAFDLAIGGADEKRLRRVLETSVRDLVTPEWGAAGRFTALAVREAPGREAPELESPAPLPATIMVYARGAPELAHEIAIDVLFRQTHPPALLLMLDDAGAGEETLPDDLWGMGGLSVTQPALLRTGGAGRAVALDIGLEHVESTYVLFAEAGDRLASRACAVLAAALDEHAKWGAAVARAWVASPAGAIAGSAELGAAMPETALAALLRGAAPAPAATLYRVKALRAAGGVVDAGGAEDVDLLLRVAQKSPVGSVDVPVAIAARAPVAGQPAAHDVLARCAAALPIERLAAALADMPVAGRRAHAYLERGRALLRVGRFDPAAADLRAAIGAGAASVAAYLDLVLAERRAGRAPDATRAADAGLAAHARAAALANARALLDFEAGDSAAAAARLEQAIAMDADYVPAHLNLAALRASKSGGRALASLATALVRQRAAGADWLIAPLVERS
jgi:tetratricopeptide (TPR) repeat protein